MKTTVANCTRCALALILGSVPYTGALLLLGTGGAAVAAVKASAGGAWDNLPAAARMVVSASIGQQHVAYHVLRKNGRFHFVNEAHGFEATLGVDGGVQLRIGQGEVAIVLKGVGYGEEVGGSLLSR
ncbi:MAG: hypothetical protein N3C12_07180 [Candidatus Binatia bacterium]|nr:hypothetical protein [Candidatus Binatia bacterium]